MVVLVGVAALGATMIIISGGIDLSVGSSIALVSVVVAMGLESLMGSGRGWSAGQAVPGANILRHVVEGARGRLVRRLQLAGRVQAEERRAFLDGELVERQLLGRF